MIFLFTNSYLSTANNSRTTTECGVHSMEIRYDDKEIKDMVSSTVMMSLLILSIKLDIDELEQVEKSPDRVLFIPSR